MPVFRVARPATDTPQREKLHRTPSDLAASYNTWQGEGNGAMRRSDHDVTNTIRTTDLKQVAGEVMRVYRGLYDGKAPKKKRAPAARKGTPSGRQGMPPGVSDTPADAIERARRRAVAFAADSERTAWHGMKVVFAFCLLDRRRMPLAGLPNFMAQTGLFRDINARFFELAPEALATQLADDLVRVGAARRDAGDLVAA